MGFLNRIVIRNLRRLLGFLFCSKQLLPPNVTEREKQWAERAIAGISIVFDLFDWINFCLDLAFAIKLFGLQPDSTFYGVVLLIGLMLGRMVSFRGSYLLTKKGGGGIRWNPFWIAPRFVRISPKYQHVFPLLYCLVFTEAGIFLFEDYPSLSIYAHWQVINLPPAPLEMFDTINVAFSAIMLSMLLALFLIALCTSLLRLDWHAWTRREKFWNSTKIVIFIVLCSLLVRFIFDVVSRAIDVTIRDVVRLPDNKMMGITFCEPITEFQDRHDFCDEQSFVIHVAFAWLAACYFSLYVFFRPLRLEDLDYDYGRNDDDDDKKKVSAATVTSKGAAAITAVSLSNGQFTPAPKKSDHGGDDDDDAHLMTMTPVTAASSTTPSTSKDDSNDNNTNSKNIHNHDITFDATMVTSTAATTSAAADAQVIRTSTPSSGADTPVTENKSIHVQPTAAAVTAAIKQQQQQGVAASEQQDESDSTYDGVYLDENEGGDDDDPEDPQMDMCSPAETAAAIVAAATGGTSSNSPSNPQQASSSSSSEPSLPLFVRPNNRP